MKIYSIAVFFALAAFPAFAQNLPAIPKEWPINYQNDLLPRKELVEKHFKEYDLKIDKYNEKCGDGKIPPNDNALKAYCAKWSDELDIESLALDREKENYMTIFNDYDKIYKIHLQSKEFQKKEEEKINNILNHGVPPVFNTDAAIVSAFKNAPAGVMEKVSKGFQLIVKADKPDFEGAKKMFQDALKLDPDNEGLKKFIVLCDYKPGTQPDKNITTPKQLPVPVTTQYVPTLEEIKAFQENKKAIDKGNYNNLHPDNTFSDQFRNYIYTLYEERSKKINSGQIPFEEDFEQTLISGHLPSGTSYVPTPQEVKAFLENSRALGDLDKGTFNPNLKTPNPAHAFSDKFRVYIKLLSKEQMVKFLGIIEPDEEDIELLFPLTISTGSPVKSK